MKDLENNLVAAALNLAGATLAHAALLPIPGTSPPLFVCYGEADQIQSLLPCPLCKDAHTLDECPRWRAAHSALMQNAELPASMPPTLSIEFLALWDAYENSGSFEYDEAKARLFSCINHLATPSQPEQAATSQVHLPTILRQFAGDNGYSHNDYADVMRQAADEIERASPARYWGAIRRYEEMAARWLKSQKRVRALEAVRAAVAEKDTELTDEQRHEANVAKWLGQRSAPAQHAEAPDAETSFNAQRLRNVMKLTGVGDPFPDSDTSLLSALGALLGDIARVLRSPAPSQGAARVLSESDVRIITRAVRYLSENDCSGPAADLKSLLATQSPAAAESAEPSAGEFAPLMKFYAVDSLAALARMQEQHIARLQAKLPKLVDESPRTPREG